MATEADELIPTRETLLIRLKNLDDQTSWREFFETYWKLIYNMARKSGFNDAAAQDIVQETLVRVSHEMPGFIYDRALGSFKSWLLQITRSRMVDAWRRKHHKVGDQFVPREEEFHTGVVDHSRGDAGAGFEAIWDEEWRTHLLDTAMERVKKHADPRQFQMFYLHVVRGVPALEVARRLGAKLPEIYFAKYKISSRLKKEIKRLENNSR